MIKANISAFLTAAAAANLTLIPSERPQNSALQKHTNSAGHQVTSEGPPASSQALHKPNSLLRISKIVKLNKFTSNKRVSDGDQ